MGPPGPLGLIGPAGPPGKDGESGEDGEVSLKVMIFVHSHIFIARVFWKTDNLLQFAIRLSVLILSFSFAS